MNRSARIATAALCAWPCGCVIQIPYDFVQTSPARRGAAASVHAPTPVGPYSQGVRVGATLYLSGQVGLDPHTSQLVAGGVAEQTRQALANLEAVLASEDMQLGDVVEVQVFLVDMADFAAMNAVYAEHFANPAPARTTVGVSALPLGAAVEIRAVAVDGS